MAATTAAFYKKRLNEFESGPGSRRNGLEHVRSNPKHGVIGGRLLLLLTALTAQRPETFTGGKRKEGARETRTDTQTAGEMNGVKTRR